MVCLKKNQQKRHQSLIKNVRYFHIDSLRWDTTENYLWCQAPCCWWWNLWVLWFARWGLNGSTWRPGHPLELVITAHIVLFLSSVCGDRAAGGTTAIGSWCCHEGVFFGKNNVGVGGWGGWLWVKEHEDQDWLIAVWNICSARVPRNKGRERKRSQIETQQGLYLCPAQSGAVQVSFLVSEQPTLCK